LLVVGHERAGLRAYILSSSVGRWPVHGLDRDVGRAPPLANRAPLVDWPAPHNNRVVSEFSCDPMTSPVVSYGEMLDVAPTHEGTFTTGTNGSEVEIEILGNSASAAYALDVQFALHSCDRAGINGGECTLLLSTFDMATTDNIEVGGYDVLDGSLTLNARVAATVDFSACTSEGCFGTFEFSETLGNPVGVNLFWLQENTQTNSIDKGAIHLSNGSGGLGGLDSLSGSVLLDSSGATGELRLVGSGRDSFGGEWAEVGFDIVGDVGPL
jgi:hypothetical protein